ncbi:uncharacterized protein LOC115785032 [Archocentrus centrarchus]|uniref:uncharacterized protein LOC115785032 n=1 Tax=Archocentrus centrarchus TaxID=63155 RepID=UPI0011E9E907|nr:uncharacterized protein LOC115785032 [Archocentrus centrarchus]
MLSAIRKNKKKRLTQGIMRSFRIFQATDMDRLVWLSLLVSHLLVAVGKTKADSCISQTKRTIWKKVGQEVDLHCKISPNCSAEDLDFDWFTFKEKIHLRLNLVDNHKYRQDGRFLKIYSLDANDSGIYYCAASPRAGCCTQHVGQSSTLVVRENVKIMVRTILLWLSFVLLAIYNLAIVMFILLKKYGYNMNICRKTSRNDKKKKTKKNIQFQDVLQEMHSKRNLKKNKQTASRSSPEVEGASSDFQSSSDDIYQNV